MGRWLDATGAVEEVNYGGICNPDLFRGPVRWQLGLSSALAYSPGPRPLRLRRRSRVTSFVVEVIVDMTDASDGLEQGCA
jgi:hypothetical protein